MKRRKREWGGGEEGRNNTKVKESLNGMQQERWSLSVQRGAEKAGAGSQDLGENRWAPDKDDGLTDMLSTNHFYGLYRKVRDLIKSHLKSKRGPFFQLSSF